MFTLSAVNQPGRRPLTVAGSDARRGGRSTARAWRAGAESPRPGRWDRPPSSRPSRRREQTDAKGAVPTDPDGRREAVNMPVAAVRAPDGDLHRGGIVPVRETVEHHRGVGGSYRHRDRLSGSGVHGRGTPRRQVAPRTAARSRPPLPQPVRRRRCRSRETKRYRHRGLGTLPPHRDRRPDIARVRRTVPLAVTFGRFRADRSSQNVVDTVWHTGQVNARGGAIWR